MGTIMQKSYEIKKIKSVANGWKLYPQDKNEKEIFISKQDYGGKIPFKLPWQTYKLDIAYVDFIPIFIISATLNGNKLFEIPKEDYPENVKTKIALEEEILQQKQEKKEKLNNEIISALKAYLPSVPVTKSVTDLEDKISKLNVDLRFYLKLHLFMGDAKPEYRQRLELMVVLCSIANRLHKRRISKNDYSNASYISGLFNLYKETRPHYSTDNIFLVKSDTTPYIRTYFETETLLKEMLPPIENEQLRKYLNYVARDVLRVFACDYAKIYERKIVGQWRIFNPSISDEAAFRYTEMQMPKYTSFVLPKVFSDKEIDYFKYGL